MAKKSLGSHERKAPSSQQLSPRSSHLPRRDETRRPGITEIKALRSAQTKLDTSDPPVRVRGAPEAARNASGRTPAARSLS
eukprot:511149-Hanusia_phi.AAC.1